MSNLADYLAKTSTTQRAFARQIGTTPSYVNELKQGAKTPSLTLAFAIERETGGEVPASSWISPIASEDTAA